MPNEELIAELAAVRECLAGVAASVSNLIPKGELDRASQAVVEDNRRWRRSVVLLVIGGPVLFLMNGLILWQGHQQEVGFRRDIRQGLSCVIGETSTHRHDARTFEIDVSRKLGIDILPELHTPSPVPGEDLDVLTKECSSAIRRFVDLSLGGGLGATGGGR